MKTTRLPLLLAATAFALTACSSGTTDTTDAGDTADATDTAEATDTGSAQGEGDEAVAIDDFAFRPETVTVPVGTTITWSNDDATAHTVTAGSEDSPDPDTFDLEVDEQGQTVSFTFDEAGTQEYFCVLHPFMTGTVEVTG